MAKKRTRTKRETLLGFLILTILVLIGVMVFFQQFQFNPAVTAHSALEGGMEQFSSGPPSTLVPLPEDFTMMTPLESFTPETLYEKINGQADLYLASGFLELKSQRYVHTDHQDMWFEVFKYDMGTKENAFAVYSQQYRDDGHPLEWTEFAYSVANALFFVHGQDYMEMRAAGTSDDLVGSMHEAAKRYVETNTLVSCPRINLNKIPATDSKGAWKTPKPVTAPKEDNVRRTGTKSARRCGGIVRGAAS